MVDPQKQTRRRPDGTSAVFVVVLLAMFASPQILFSETFDVSPDRSVTLLDRSGGAHTVYWTARTFEQGGVFRLYSGHRLDLLEVAVSEPASQGLKQYTVSGEAPPSPWFIYQLRYVQPSGAEEVLTTVVVNQRRFERDGVGVDLPSPIGKALIDLAWTSPRHAQDLQEPIEVQLPSATPPRPEVPPPRRSWESAALMV